jgi:hypothetical protein
MSASPRNSLSHGKSLAHRSGETKLRRLVDLADGSEAVTTV